ncbi:Ras GTPase-activating protein 1 [Homalodisca vitripennis]|nr:Ras GTPase-activating protein 1 [Homalodisca vitripennis]
MTLGQDLMGCLLSSTYSPDLAPCGFHLFPNIKRWWFSSQWFAMTKNFKAVSKQDWINALKPLCVTQMTRSPKVQRLRELRCLQLNIIDAHRFLAV